MKRVTLYEDSRIRSEPGLRDALSEAARREGVTSSEFLRRELRALLERRGILIPATAKFSLWNE